MKNIFRIFASVLILTVFAQVSSAQVVQNGTSTNATSTGPTKEDLENLIKERAAALEKLNRDIEVTQQNLRDTQQEKSTLQQEVKSLDSNIIQLELNIRSDEVTSQKLAFEIDALGYDIRDTELSIGNKKDAVSVLIRKLQQKEREHQNPLVIFLKNGTLADGVLETQSLTNLRSQIAIDIDNLRSLHAQMTSKAQEVKNKKAGLETHKKTLAVRKVIVQDQKEEKKTVLEQTKNKEAVFEQQVEDLKKQQEDLSDEIEKIEEELLKNFDVSILPTKRPNAFIWPITLVSQGGKGRITQHMGARSKLYRGKPHNGLDIGAPIGTPVLAAEDGVVSAVDNNDKSTRLKYQYGKYIVIKHQNNLATLYAHLSQQVVGRGETVKRGQIIGYSGNTGYSTGAHLHFGLYWGPSIEYKAVPPAAGRVPVGVVLDPEDYL